jgi:hypothetical protein
MFSVTKSTEFTKVVFILNITRFDSTREHVVSVLSVRTV